jgi:transcriptional regulator with XRE-family HTH domain
LSPRPRSGAGGEHETSSIGARLKHLRTERGLSLRDVAAAGGVSASLLSQLERDLANPSISTLQRIARSLHVSIFALLPEDGRAAAAVVRPDDRRKLVIQDGQLHYELLSPDASRQMEVWMGRLGPGAEMGSDTSSHASEEFILVLGGRMEILLGGEIYLLEEGAAIQYDGNVPHRITNAGDEELSFLSALTPPTL